MEDHLFGKKLVNLPPPHTEAVTVKAADAERILYTAVSNRMIELQKEKLNDDDPLKHLSNKLAQITCSRQLVNFSRIVLSISDYSRLTANPDLIEDEILVRRSSQFLFHTPDNHSSCSTWNVFKLYRTI